MLHSVKSVAPVLRCEAAECSNKVQVVVSAAKSSPLPCLVANNRLCELREIQRLRELPKMIILDLAGNPCTAVLPEDYRLFVIYNVRKLKVGEARLSLLRH